MTENAVPTTETVAAIVGRELGESPSAIAAVEEGYLHETYVVHCASGAYVVQFAAETADDRMDSLSRGVGCYDLLQDTAVPVPRVVTGTGRTSAGRRYVIVEKLPGEPGERDVSPARARNAGRCLARIHGVGRFETAGWLRFADGRPTVRAFPEGSLEQRVQHDAARSARALHSEGLTAAANAVEDAATRAGERLPETGPPVLRHGDYSPDNVLFREDEVTGVVDFDRATVGHALRDLVQAANGFWMHDPCAGWDPRGAFYEGYRAERGLPDGFDRGEPLYRVVTLARTVAGMLDLGECADDERAFYAERLVEAADRVDGG